MRPTARARSVTLGGVDDLHPGARFAGCRIDAVAGRGGMGVVYRATDLALGRRVALKVVAPERAAESDFTERFGREVRLAAAIDHPNVVPVYGAGEEDGRLYLVMRYVDGTDLHALLRRERRLDPARAAAIVAQVAAALDAAHAAGLVHRDVKPANVLLTAPGDHVYLTDFGLSVEVSSETRLTTTGQWIGSVDYMAPEQLRAEAADARADVYALGGVLHAALTGEPPFRRTTAPQTMAAHLDEPPPRPSDQAAVDPAFDAVVARAMAKDPADRHPSAGDLGRAVLAAARGERVTIGERVVARGPAAPSEDRTEEITSHAATRQAPGRAAGRGGAPGGPEDRGPEHPGWSRTGATSLFRDDAQAPAGGSSANGTAVAGEGGAAAAGGGAAGAGSAAAAGGAAGRPAPRVRRHRTRSRWRVRLALVLLVVAVAAAVLAGLGGGGGGRSASAALSADEVRGVAQDFAAAYGDEDLGALSATVARDVQRVGPDGDQRGRAAVLAVYRRQFAAGEIEGYELDDLEVVPGSAGRAGGSYVVRRKDADDIKGRVAFGVVREAGRPRIVLISTQPE